MKHKRYSKLYEVAVVRSLVYKAQKTVCQVCSLDNTFIYKISYTSSLLQILHILIPSNTWYYKCNTQCIIYIRRHPISAHHLNSYNLLHKLPSETSLTTLEHWLNCLIWYKNFYIVNVCLWVTISYLYM